MTNALWIEETHLDADGGYLLGEPFAYETGCDQDETGELFRSLQKEYGRCVSKVYIDTEDGKTQTIGWVFQRKQGYEDVPEKKYTHEVWITLLRDKPTVTVTKEYEYLGSAGNTEK